VDANHQILVCKLCISLQFRPVNSS